MKQTDIIELIKKIDRFYKTDYAGEGEIVKDWFKVLKNYELQDMTNSLEYYMKNYTTYPPKVYDLTRGYKSIESKKLLERAKTRCLFCGETIKIDDEKHVNKCRSIEFIKSAVRRFKNQEIDVEKYRTMNDEEFNKYYKAAQKLIIENSTNQKEVEICKKCIDKSNTIC